MNRRRHLNMVVSIGVLCFMSGLWAGCVVDFETDPGTDGVFSCTTEADCIEGFECNDGVCVDGTLPPRSSPPCEQAGNLAGDIDLDNDGYGTGVDRTDCPRGKYQTDCDDSDPTVHPNAPELCDNKDNNCDGDGPDGANRVDEFDCDTVTDCGAEPSELGHFLDYECIDGACVMRPPVRPEGSVCEQILVTCDSAERAFTYETNGQTHQATDVPSECR